MMRSKYSLQELANLEIAEQYIKRQKGTNYPYLPGPYVLKMLDDTFGIDNWDFDVKSYNVSVVGSHIVQSLCLTLNMHTESGVIRRDGVAIEASKMSEEGSYKTLDVDCKSLIPAAIKSAMRNLGPGFGLDLGDKHEFHHTHIEWHDARKESLAAVKEIVPEDRRSDVWKKISADKVALINAYRSNSMKALVESVL